MTKTEKDYHTLATSRNFKWTGTKLPKNTLVPTEWECEKGHVWRQRYNAIYRGTGCPACHNPTMHKVGYRIPKRITEQDYSDTALIRGFIWRGQNIPDDGVIGNTTWQCQQGHTWEESLVQLKGRTYCPKCQEEKIKLKHENAQKLFNISLISVGKNSNTKSVWACEMGHLFSKSLQELHQLKLPVCPICKETRITPETYKEVAKDRGFVWLGPYPRITVHKTRWKCNKGHIWEATINNVGRHASGCPVCANSLSSGGRRTSKRQKDLARLIDNGTENLKVGRYSIDVALSSEKIAIEYDTYFWHRQFVNTEDTEKRKDEFLNAQGWKIIRIRTNNKLPTKEKINQALLKAKNGVAWQEIVLDDWSAESSWEFPSE